MMKQGDDALAAKKYADAVKAYDEALKLKPGDAAAIRGKRAATDAQKPAQPKADPKAELRKALDQGAASEKLKKHADAVNWYQSARKWANDVGDRNALAQAYLGVGRNEHAQKRYPEAVRAYEEVLKRDANNAEAKAALARAKANKP
jgi:tetratricopeptide (TPR) repeat protein